MSAIATCIVAAMCIGMGAADERPAPAKPYGVGIVGNCCTHGAGLCGMFKGCTDTRVIAAYEKNPKRGGELAEALGGPLADSYDAVICNPEVAIVAIATDPCDKADMVEKAAAATGDDRYARTADKMADFFIRTQTQSETHPELDGTWYRGFDFKKWDYWASDGDWGWGVWTAESGWTHSWITATLALREMNTSLWTLTQNKHVQKSFEALRLQMLPDDVLSDRTQIDLSGQWRFQVDRQNEGETAGWSAESHDTNSWIPVTVPIGFDDCGPGMERYAGAGWFRRSIYVPESFRGRRVALRFDGISYNAKVWVNGKCVGENHDAFLPFELPIDGTVRVGAENQITLRVDNVRQRAQFPLFEGWYGQGGFLRKAYLIATDRTYIDHTFIEARPAPSGGQLRVRAAVTNGGERALPAQIHVRVTDARGRELATFASSSISMEPGKTGELSADVSVPGVQLWSPDTPTLYTVRVALLQEGRLLDTQTRRAGFRSIDVRDAKLLLNGQPLFLMGFNRHEDSPHTGMAIDLQQAREDFTAMKELGCNFVRLCHYPHDSGELDLCDELGLLVQAENAMNEWGRIDHPDPNGGIKLKPEDAPLVLENAKRSLRKMVSRDNHHPSILFWSVSNENAEERPEVAAGNQELIQFGRTLDPTRPWAHDSNSFNKRGWESFYQADDLIVVNVYPTHRLTITPGDLDAGLPQATKYMEDTLAKLHQQFPSKPIVIGEFGYFGGESGEEGARLQSIATEAEFNGLGAPYVAGCALWVYARHAWGTKAYYARDNLISPYGYVSRDRKTRFEALSVVERLYKERVRPARNAAPLESGASGAVGQD